MLTFAQTRNVGVSLLVSMGNESMVSMTDVMRYLIDDDATRVIALFIESVRQPAEFIALAREALATGKPIVAIKVGRSQTGARVARAHTGSLVGDDAVVDAVFRQHGVIRVDCLEDLIITAGLLAATGPLPGNRFGFVTAVRRRQRDHRRPGRGRGHRDPRVRARDRRTAAAGACPSSPPPRTRSTSPATSWSTGTCSATRSPPCTTTPAWTRSCSSPTCRGPCRPTRR